MKNEKVLDATLNWILLLAPLWFYAGSKSPDIFAGQKLFMQAAALFLIGIFHFNCWIGAFVLLTGAHYFLFDCPFFESYAVNIACGAVIYHFVAKSYSGNGYRWIIAGILVWTLALSGLQRFGMDILFWQNREPSGMWTLPSYMGIFAAVTGGVMLSLWPMAVFLNIAALAFSKSSIAVIAFGSGLTPFFKKKWLILSLIALIPGVFLIFKDKQSGEWERRLNIWPMVISTAFRSPFFGAGVGNYNQWAFIEFRGKRNHYFQVKLKAENEQPTKDMILKIAKEEGTDTSRIEQIHFKEPFAPFRNMKDIMDDLRGKPVNAIHGYVWNHCHNEYIQLFFEYGLFGVWLLAMYCSELFRAYFRRAQPSEVKALFGCLIAVLVVSCGHFAMYVPRLAVPIIFLLALLDARLKKL